MTPTTRNLEDVQVNSFERAVRFLGSIRNLLVYILSFLIASLVIAAIIIF